MTGPQPESYDLQLPVTGGSQWPLYSDRGPTGASRDVCHRMTEQSTADRTIAHWIIGLLGCDLSQRQAEIRLIAEVTAKMAMHIPTSMPTALSLLNVSIPKYSRTLALKKYRKSSRCTTTRPPYLIM